MMKRTLFSGSLLLALLLALALSGCSESDNGLAGAEPTGGDDYVAMDMDDVYGGLTVSDEPTDFADEYFQAEAVAAEFAEADDPMAVDPEVLLLEEAGGDPADPARPRFSFVKITWGMLDRALDDPAIDAAGLDWTGMLNVDRGIAIARRTILFEEPGDHLILPRIDRHTVAWTSHTGRGYDGLIIEIIEPPLDPDSTAPIIQNQLHLMTPQFRLDIPVSDLSDLDLVEKVDELGNAIRCEGFRLSEIDLCPKGFLSGKWMRIGQAVDTVAYDRGVRGYFKGRWIDVLGIARGVVRGAWGVNGEGEQVFAGKWIDNHGRFKGLLRGAWGSADGDGYGEFRGHWTNRAGSVEGKLGGKWFLATGRPAGFFAGRWATLCDDEASNGIE